MSLDEQQSSPSAYAAKAPNHSTAWPRGSELTEGKHGSRLSRRHGQRRSSKLLARMRWGSVGGSRCSPTSSWLLSASFVPTQWCAAVSCSVRLSRPAAGRTGHREWCQGQLPDRHRRDPRADDGDCRAGGSSSSGDQHQSPGRPDADDVPRSDGVVPRRRHRDAERGFETIGNFSHEFFKPCAITFDYSAMTFSITKQH